MLFFCPIYSVKAERGIRKTEYFLLLVAVYPNGKISYLFYFQKPQTQHRKNEVSKVIESNNKVSKDLEKALQALEQAKQRVTNEKKKQNEKKRKAENESGGDTE